MAPSSLEKGIQTHFKLGSINWTVNFPEICLLPTRTPAKVKNKQGEFQYFYGSDEKRPAGQPRCISEMQICYDLLHRHP